MRPSEPPQMTTYAEPGAASGNRSLRRSQHDDLCLDVGPGLELGRKAEDEEEGREASRRCFTSNKEDSLQVARPTVCRDSRRMPIVPYPWQTAVDAPPPAPAAKPKTSGDWRVENEYGALIGEYSCGKAAFAAAQSYLASLPHDTVSYVIYPDGFRLTERKAAA